MEAVKPREPQYAECFNAVPVTLGPMSSNAYRRDPKRLGFTLARYKFVSQMVRGFERVAEIGCADAFGSSVVREAVGILELYDFDEAWRKPAEAATGCRFYCHDIRTRHLGGWSYEAIYMLDVLEHIAPADEPAVLRNVQLSLDTDGVFIAGCPSLESQVYASSQSKIGHVNCRTGDELHSVMKRHFNNVFLFCMNDETLHVGFSPMAHYLLVVCTGPKVPHRK